MSGPIISILLPAFLFTGLALPLECMPANDQIDSPAGYRDIAACRDHFIAVGTGGRIDRLDQKGRLLKEDRVGTQNLNAVLVLDDEVLVAGDGGTLLLYGEDGYTKKLQAGTEQNLHGLTVFNGMVLAGGAKATLLISKDTNRWQSISLPAEGSIVSLSANNSRCFAVTGQGLILSSSDGFQWEVFNYNREYAGYTRACSFATILATESGLVILGQYEDQSPVALFSQEGKVWVERQFQYEDEDGIRKISTNKPNDIAYDPVRDHFVVACTGGEVFCFPTCIKCNSSYVLTDKDFRGICSNGGRNVLVGEDFETSVLFL